MTPELKHEIQAELRKVRAPAKAARNLGVDIRDVLRVSDEIGGASRTIRTQKHGGEGRPELRHYAVARKRAYQPWDNADPEIAAARAAWEAGTHILCTGRDGEFLILYLIPRRGKPEPRPDYFRPEF